MEKQKSLALSTGEIKCNIVRSSRRTVCLSINNTGTLTIRAPRFVTESALLEFARSKEDWILKHKQKITERLANRKEITFNAGDTIPYLGYSLKLDIRHNGKITVRADGSEIFITCPDINDKTLIKAVIEKWYHLQAKNMLVIRTIELSEKYRHLGLVPSHVGVRKMTSKWGTCRTNGRITLNSELIKRRQDLIDSVILHELCHLRHPNHGKEFYALLESLMPQYRQLRKEMRYI